MIGTLISLSVTFLVGVLIWFGLDVMAPDIYVEKAFGYIFYPSIGAGIVTALSWSSRRRHGKSK